MKGAMTISVNVPETKDELALLYVTSYSETIRLAIKFALQNKKEFMEYVRGQHDKN